MNFSHVKRCNKFLRNKVIEMQRNQNCVLHLHAMFAFNPFNFFSETQKNMKDAKHSPRNITHSTVFSIKKNNKVHSSFLVYDFFFKRQLHNCSSALSRSIAFSIFDPPQRSRDPLELWFLTWFRNPGSVAGNHLRPTKNPEAA